jgi:hypothetical protein
MPDHSTNGRPVPTVGYWRMSSSPQEKSIPQQKAEMLPKAQLHHLEIVQEFEDKGISGGGMKKRDAFLDMVRFCEGRQEAGKPVEAIVCYDTSRFSRADSNETSAYIWRLRQAGVNRLLTWERWYDFRKEEDRAIFNIQQDFTNNRYLRDLSARILRGKKAVAAAGYFTGGMVPYGFDRVLLDSVGKEVMRIPRGEQVRLRKQGWREALAPILETDPDPARQLQRQTVLWLYETFTGSNVSYRWLAEQLNLRSVPGPGSHYHRQKERPGQSRWTVRAVTGILTNPIYAGVACLGRTGKGAYHRLVSGEVRAVEPGARKATHTEGLILTRLDHGGLIDPRTWERAQEKARERARLGIKPRTGGYVLPGGILYCGHCGGRMYGCTMRPKRGRKVYEYRKYTCGSPNVKPGTCRHYSVDEKVIVDILVDQLLNVYAAPERLAGARKKLLEKAEAKHQKAPAQIERLRRRLEQLNTEVRDATRNVLRAKDNVDVLNEALTELRHQRDRAERELEAAERVQAAPVDESRDRVEAAIARLSALREQLELAYRQGKKELLGEIIRQMVSRVDVYFEPVQTGRRTWFRFVKSAIKVRPLLTVSGNEHQVR